MRALVVKYLTEAREEGRALNPTRISLRLTVSYAYLGQLDQARQEGMFVRNTWPAVSYEWMRQYLSFRKDPNDPEYYREYAHSSLKDGRLYLLRGSRRNFLMTPDPVGKPTYEPISYPYDPMHLHKICISHDETKISYMKQTMEDLPKDEYMGGIICYADFDASVPAITNEVEITEQDYGRIIWYTSFSPDDKCILYTDSGKVMLHDIEAGTNRQISTDDSLEHRYPNSLDSIK